MRLKRETMFIFFVAFMLLLTISNLANAEINNKTTLQMVAHQQSVGADGEIHYSILYHVPEAPMASEGEITVEVPNGLTVKSKSHDAWDESNNTLTWSFNFLEDNRSGIIPVQLKVPSDIKEGNQIVLASKGEFNGEVVVSPDVTVEVTTEIHQPFFQGYPDGTFQPSSNLTRAETAAIVSRIKNLENDSKLENPYEDVASSHWAINYIREVTHEGYMQGYKGDFRPDEPITRAELITLALRLRGVEAIPVHPFGVTEGHWAKNMIGTAYGLGFLNTDHQSIVPDSYVPRDESAKLLDLAFYRGKLVDGEIAVIQHFPDVNKDHWAYHWIEEASMVAHESVRNGENEELIQYLPENTEPF